jgi:hypothetical protein
MSNITCFKFYIHLWTVYRLSFVAQCVELGFLLKRWILRFHNKKSFFLFQSNTNTLRHFWRPPAQLSSLRLNLSQSVILWVRNRACILWTTCKNEELCYITCSPSKFNLLFRGACCLRIQRSRLDLLAAYFVLVSFLTQFSTPKMEAIYFSET